MNPIDLTVFILYIGFVLGMGYYFMRKNTDSEDYYVGGRKIGPVHIGLSVVATDVGGGFSIGLGGLGFIMGLSGSWMLFTGFLGAWISAVLLIPRVKNLSTEKKFQTLPEVFGYFYSPKVAIAAAIISAVGYFGFTSSQMLAGAKLASSAFEGISISTALYFMGAIIIVYTVMGGIKAVIYTDTVQWTILFTGLIFIGIPLGYNAVGGIEGIREVVEPEFLTLTNLTWQTFVNWMVTILPIWFVGMTLYQRIYASRSEKDAQKAWYLAGLFEWPLMAFMGVSLGLFARVALEQGMFAGLGFAAGAEMDEELGLPMLLRTILPAGLMGLMMAAYFSAIMSTADSCLVASSGSTMSDLINKYLNWDNRSSHYMRLSQIVTLVIGVLALILALISENVLTLMLQSYAVMVSGLFVPIIGALYWRKSTPQGAMAGILGGGGVTLGLIIAASETFESFAQFLYESYGITFGRIIADIEIPFGLDPIIFGISASAILFVICSLLSNKKIKS